MQHHNVLLGLPVYLYVTGVCCEKVVSEVVLLGLVLLKLIVHLSFTHPYVIPSVIYITFYIYIIVFIIILTLYFHFFFVLVILYALVIFIL